MKSKAWTEKFMQVIFAVAACASVLAVALICIFLFANGIPAMSKIGFGKFLTGELWRPKNDIYGIFPMIVGSLYVTAGAIIIGVPIGILTAVFMAFYCPKAIYRPLKMATELLGGNPVRCIWILRTGRSGTVGKRNRTKSSPGRQRKQYDHCIHSAWNDDPADDHRSDRISTQSSSDTVLRRCCGTWRNT